MCKHPWEVEGVPWKSESAYWSWVRGTLRKGWNVHPVKIQYINKHRKQIPNPNPNGRKPTVWGMTCTCCGNDFALHIPVKTKKQIKEKLGIDIVTIEINHKTAASSLKCKEDLADFAQRLFYVTFDDLEPLCKTCHDIYSYMDRWGISFEEAKLQKSAIAICKGDEKAWLEEKGIKPESNAEKRRKQVEDYLRYE